MSHERLLEDEDDEDDEDEEDLDLAWFAGHAAFYDGLSAERNPHLEESDDWFAWLHGYYRAMRSARERYH
jgi:hypothetical protein